MIRLVQRRLIIPRGDTGSFTLPVISSLNIGDVAVFTIFDTKRQAKIFQKIVEPENNALVIRFEHAMDFERKSKKLHFNIYNLVMCTGMQSKSYFTCQKSSVLES